MRTGENPLVSIIIPTFNRAHLIGETLDSVVRQTYSNWECLVIDDGSVDRTEETVGRYTARDARIRFYQRPSDFQPGGCGSRNFGLRKAEGKYIQWFDDDDLMLDNHLESCVFEAERKKLSILIVRNKHFGATEKIRGTSNVAYSNCLKTLTAQYISKQIVLGTPCLFLSREVIGGALWNEKLKSKQDCDFIGRFLIESIGDSVEFSALDRATVLIRKHADSISNRNKCDSHLNEFFVRVNLYALFSSRHEMNYQERVILTKLLKKITTGIVSCGFFNFVKLALMLSKTAQLKKLFPLFVLGTVWKLSLIADFKNGKRKLIDG